MASLKAVSVTHVRYEVGDDIGHIMAWASLLPILISAGFISHFIFRRELLAMFFAAGLIMSEFCNEKIKEEVKQARPLTCELLEMCDSHGWPSSHSQYMSFFSTFISLSALFRWSFHGSLRRAMVVLLPWPFAVLTMYSRIYLGYHTVSQVFAGAGAGLVMGSLWYFVVYRLMVPLFPVIEETRIARAFYIKDSGHIQNVLKFEYENSRRARRGGATADGSSKLVAPPRSKVSID
ncbi:lipid phosphate phosphatase gamma [Selaginella moellendorffii]|uniref:lipid phosphate phosphatase gamma n=1 Tax=Selaginella moellendorffii TaxID=88036 RepID=UPI000D1C4D9E|nr:lipid phosphate phosphatase gamma [Selaginella moellendorffii]XP_024527786.1 lipid phosphate phosphatase gamma [Selaginella moellendorffii]|eukprot:XP_002967148.2 lipid phosphate phosphatase gamma [Selaginella moellendorffii]